MAVNRQEFALFGANSNLMYMSILLKYPTLASDDVFHLSRRIVCRSSFAS